MMLQVFFLWSALRGGRQFNGSFHVAEDDDMGHEMGHLFDYATDPEGYLTDMATLLSAENINVPNPSDNAETPTLEESNGFAWELDVASEIGGEGAFTGPDWFTAGSTSSYGQMVTFENSIMPPDTDHDFWVPSNVPSAFDSVPDTTLPTIPNIPLIGLSPDAIAEIAFSNQMASEDNASFESMSASGDLQIDVSGYPT